MSVAGKPEVEGQPRDVFTTRQIDKRAVEPQSRAVTTKRHAFRPREGVGEVSAGHLNRACDLVERNGFAQVCVQKLLCLVHNVQRRSSSSSLRRRQRFVKQSDALRCCRPAHRCVAAVAGRRSAIGRGGVDGLVEYCGLG